MKSTELLKIKVFYFAMLICMYVRVYTYSYINIQAHLIVAACITKNFIQKLVSLSINTVWELCTDY